MDLAPNFFITLHLDIIVVDPFLKIVTRLRIIRGGVLRGLCMLRFFNVKEFVIKPGRLVETRRDAVFVDE